MNSPDGWYAIADARRVRHKPLGVRRFEKDLVLWRDRAGVICCLPASCPHRGGDLSLGRVRDDYLECPYHGFRFDLTGRCVATPCEGPDVRIPHRLRSEPVPVRVEHDWVWMWSGSGEPAASVPWFDDLGPDQMVVTTCGSYDCHLTRYMENTLDVHHFAFVHRSVLPFVGSWVKMTRAELDGEVIRVEGELHPSPGESLRRPTRFALQARLPTLVRLTTAGIDLLAAACPIDEYRTWVAARYYRPRLGRGAVARATSWLCSQADWRTAQRQDRRILASIQPRLGSPHNNIGVGADRPIALWYRQWLAPDQTSRRDDDNRGTAVTA